MRHISPALIVATALAFVCLASLDRPATADDAAATQPSDDVVTGEFQTTFTLRSPLSAPAELAKRFGMNASETITDYDIATDHPWRVYVPAGYDATNPPGMFVCIADPKPMPAALKSLFDSKYLIFAATNSFPPAQQAGLLLDVVTNIEKQYAVDKSRIYFLDIEDGHFVAFAVDDVYTGFIVIKKLDYPGKLTMPIQNGTQSVTSDDEHHVEDNLMKIARRRGYAYVFPTDLPATDTLFLMPDEMKSNGFQYVKVIKAPPDKWNYPDIDPAWLKESLTFLDAVEHGQSKPKAARPLDIAHAATEPTEAASAQSLFSLANTYITNGQPDLAKKKLNELIEQYPSDPLADQAKTLLDQLNNQ